MDGARGIDSSVITYFDYQFDYVTFSDSLDNTFAFYPYDVAYGHGPAQLPGYEWKGDCNSVKFPPTVSRSLVSYTAASSLLDVRTYPNPFRQQAHIGFNLSEASEVKIALYNMSGQMLTLLANGEYSRGAHEITFDAHDLPSGVYTYRLEAGGKSVIKQMVLEK